ncbi:hypothetical protein EVAR_20156_1 [Eumeta japonica]|uniref:Uncharacterized protein n=1 Tax=Eumeta variegata TaxID=151549 RepID=A0A4C1V415_EUMVA|nr:hypothetical protein EVAR_20156_1 [Eumeta japonica]
MHQNAFKTVKRALGSELMLEHYELASPPRAQVDASPADLSAGLAAAGGRPQKSDSDRSLSLTLSGRVYSQIQKQFLRNANNITGYLSRSQKQTPVVPGGSNSEPSTLLRARKCVATGGDAVFDLYLRGLVFTFNFEK